MEVEGSLVTQWVWDEKASLHTKSTMQKKDNFQNFFKPWFQKTSFCLFLLTILRKLFQFSALTLTVMGMKTQGLFHIMAVFYHQATSPNPG